MKIPFGYGSCWISFSSGSQPNGVGQNVYFKIDQSSFFEVDEWSEEWTTLARSREKDIYGYHFNFDLRLIDDSLQSGSTQNNLTNFLYYYNLNQYKDKRFFIFPYYSSGDGFPEMATKGMFEVITTGYPTLTNLAETSRAKGQYLHLKCKTKFMIDKDDYNYLMYRETSDDSWGILPTVTVQGQGDTPIGSRSDNRITAANDAGFESGTIGNWVVYTDGNGTCAYSADNPEAGDKTALITVGATPGTYTGMSLSTSAITAFVDGTTYKIRMRVWLDSGNNNFTKISILPTSMTWTKVSETIATLTTEDQWQTVEAIYTAGADVTGEITIKGESTTAADIFYVDDIEITEY